MGQNTSHAVMAQRHEPKDSLDDFPTPPWAVRALCEKILLKSDKQPSRSVWEPACGRGYMAKTLGEYFAGVYASDIHDYGYGKVEDFLTGGVAYSKPDWIITNPPFKHAEEFSIKGQALARIGCAMLVRTSFLEGVGRHDRLFTKWRPTTVAQFSERVPMVKGRIDKKASTATSYCWILWEKVRGNVGITDFVWIPPCRKQLEKDSDYR